MKENRLKKVIALDEKKLDRYLSTVAEKEKHAVPGLSEKAQTKSISFYPEDRKVLNTLKRYLEDETDRNISISDVYRAALYAVTADKVFLQAYRDLID